MPVEPVIRSIVCVGDFDNNSISGMGYSHKKLLTKKMYKNNYLTYLPIVQVSKTLMETFVIPTIFGLDN